MVKIWGKDRERLLKMPKTDTLDLKVDDRVFAVMDKMHLLYICRMSQLYLIEHPTTPFGI